MRNDRAGALPGTKIILFPSLKRIVKRLKQKGKRIVFTNGCFDILHYGHVKYLQDAKRKGDYLVVAVNSDSSIKKIKVKKSSKGKSKKPEKTIEEKKEKNIQEKKETKIQDY